jgi:hypothetical protein
MVPLRASHMGGRSDQTVMSQEATLAHLARAFNLLGHGRIGRIAWKAVIGRALPYWRWVPW